MGQWVIWVSDDDLVAMLVEWALYYVSMVHFSPSTEQQKQVYVFIDICQQITCMVKQLDCVWLAAK